MSDGQLSPEFPQTFPVAPSLISSIREFEPQVGCFFFLLLPPPPSFFYVISVVLGGVEWGWATFFVVVVVGDREREKGAAKEPEGPPGHFFSSCCSRLFHRRARCVGKRIRRKERMNIKIKERETSFSFLKT